MSAQKVSRIVLVGSVIALAIGLLVLLAPQAAVAQCEDPKPTCCTCHATAHLVATEGEWHTIHARKECCRACHGGNDRADDKDAAHAGMTLNPLQDTYLACHQCHPDDYRQRAERFATMLGVTPQSHEPVTTTVVLNSSGGVPMVQRPTPPTSSSGGAGPWWLLGLLAVAALALAGVSVTRHRLSQ